MKKLFEQLTTPEVMAEVLALLMAALLATALAHYIKHWLRPMAARDDLPRWPKRFVVAGMVLAPSLLGVLLILGLRVLFASFDLHTGAHRRRAGPRHRAGAGALRRARPERLAGPEQLDPHLGAAHHVPALGRHLVPGARLVRRHRTHARRHRPDPRQDQFSLWALLKGIVVIVGFLVATSLIARTIERRVMKLEGLAISTRIGISKFSTFLLFGLGVLLGINASGVDLTVLGLIAGAIGLGLGFGLQAIASNFVSGFVLLLDKSIKPGDVISFTGTTGTSTENFGWVQELRGRYIVVRDRDGVETLVPNQNLITNSVINWSYSDQRVRIRLPVHISFQDDPEVALQVLIDAAANHPRILKDPGPVSRLMSFENYGMRVEVRFWIRDPMNGVNNVRSDVNREIWRLFKKHGITIPVQQHDVRLVQAEPEPGFRVIAVDELAGQAGPRNSGRRSRSGVHPLRRSRRPERQQGGLRGAAAVRARPQRHAARRREDAAARARRAARHRRRRTADRRARVAQPGTEPPRSRGAAARSGAPRAGRAEETPCHQADARLERAAARRQGALAEKQAPARHRYDSTTEGDDDDRVARKIPGDRHPLPRDAGARGYRRRADFPGVVSRSLRRR